MRPTNMHVYEIQNPKGGFEIQLFPDQITADGGMAALVNHLIKEGYLWFKYLGELSIRGGSPEKLFMSERFLSLAAAADSSPKVLWPAHPCYGRSPAELAVYEAVWEAIEEHCRALEEKQPFLFGLAMLHTDSADISRLSKQLQKDASVAADFSATLFMLCIKRKLGSEHFFRKEFEAVCTLEIRKSSQSQGSGLPEARVLESIPVVNL